MRDTNPFLSLLEVAKPKIKFKEASELPVPLHKNQHPTHDGFSSVTLPLAKGLISKRHHMVMVFQLMNLRDTQILNAQLTCHSLIVGFALCPESGR